MRYDPNSPEGAFYRPLGFIPWMNEWHCPAGHVKRSRFSWRLERWAKTHDFCPDCVEFETKNDENLHSFDHFRIEKRPKSAKTPPNSAQIKGRKVNGKVNE